MSAVKEIGVSEFDAEVLRSPEPVLVDFYSPACPPCRMLEPELESLADFFAGRVRIVKVDASREPLLAARYSITGVPTLMLFKGGIIVDVMVGYQRRHILKGKLERVVGGTFSVQTS